MPGVLHIALALAAAGGPILLARWAARRGRQVPWPLVAMQSGAALLAAMALARPTAPIGREASRPYLVLRDVSASVRGQDANLPLPPELPREVFDFAGGVGPAGAALPAETTRLTPALQLARARGGEVAAVVLHTDGQFADDWRAAAAGLAETRAAVLVVPMDSPPPDTRMVGLAARRMAGGEVDLAVSVASNQLDRRTLSVRRGLGAAGNVRLLERRLDLLANAPAGLRLTDANAPAAVAADYEASLSAGDAFPENDAAFAVVPPRVRRLALVGEGALSAEAIAAAGGVPAVAVPGAAAPTGAAGWADYAGVVLQDPCGTLLAPAARAALADYVAAGGGLLLVGAAPHATPADRDDPLTRAAALRANPYQRRPLRIVLVLDASGSMAEADAAGAGGAKFDQAIEAVAALQRHLTPADALSAISFSDSPRRVYDSGRGEIDFAALRQALRAVRPGGPTDAGKALVLAAETPSVEGRDGLVLLVSDLLTRLERPDVLARSFREAKLKLGMVAIRTPGAAAAGKPYDLEALARSLDSPPVVWRENLLGLAEVFASFLRDARGSALRSGAFAAAGDKDGAFQIGAAMPEVRAYLLSAAAPTARTTARVGGDGDPLLAYWQFGMGRSVTLALDPRKGANPAWDASGKLADLAGRAAAWAAGTGDDPRFIGSTEWADGALRLAIDAADANGPINGLRLQALLNQPPWRAPRTFDLAQTAPGRYEARADAPGAAAVLSVKFADAAASHALWQTTLPRLPAREFAAIGADWATLRELARRTGGRIAARGELASLGRQFLRRGRTDLWPFLAAAAVALMLLEWSLARVHRRPAKGPNQRQ
jgi:hypothetical protein